MADTTKNINVKLNVTQGGGGGGGGSGGGSGSTGSGGGLAAMLKQAFSGVQGAGTALAGIAGGNIMGSGGALGAMAGNLAGGPLGGAIGGAVGGAPQMLMDTLTKLADMVGTFNQSTATEFFRVFKDITAVFGMVFMPVVQTATKYLRTWADAIFGATGGLEKYFSGMSSVFDSLLPAFSAMLDIVGAVRAPFAELAGALMDRVIPMLKWMAEQLAHFATGIVAFLGIQNRKKSSFGMGGIDSSYTSIEGLGKGAHTAFMTASRAYGQKDNVAAKSPLVVLQEIAGRVEVFVANTYGKIEDVTKLVGIIVEKIPGLI